MNNVGSMSPYEIPSQLQGSEKCVIFRAGPTLCVEFSAEVCDAGSPDALMAAVLDAATRVRNAPFVTDLSDEMSDAIEEWQAAQHKVDQILMQWESKLAAHGLGVPLVATATAAAAAAQATAKYLGKSAARRGARFALKRGKRLLFTPGGILFLYVVVYVAIRYAHVIITHNSSRLGGVFITFPPPYIPLQFCAEIWPRGGPSGERLDKARELGGLVVQKLQPHVQGKIDAVKAQAKTLPKPGLPRRG